MSTICSRTIYCLFITLLWNQIADSKSVKANEYKHIRSVPLSPYGGTSFDYDFDPDSHLGDTYRQNSNSNSFMEYWQNMMRNVRLPFINWNLTNPLGNILNSEVEEPSIQHRQKPKRKRKSSSKRKHENQIKHDQQQSNDNINQIQTQQEQQMLQQQYQTNLDEYESSYFYDPETYSYYKVTRVDGGFGSYNPESQLTNIYAEPQFISEPLDYSNSIAVDMQHVDAVDEDKNEEDMNLEEGRKMNWKEIGIENETEAKPNRASSKNLDQQEKSTFPIITEETLKAILGGHLSDNDLTHRSQNIKKQRKVKSQDKPWPRKLKQKYFYRFKRN